MSRIPFIRYVPLYAAPLGLAAILCGATGLASAQNVMTTVLNKSPGRAETSIAAVLAQCAPPKLPLRLAAGISLVASKVVHDSSDGREVSLRTYRFTQTLEKVLPELKRAGVELRFEPPGDLHGVPVGTVWHGYNEMDGMEATRELTCSRVTR